MHGGQSLKLWAVRAARRVGAAIMVLLCLTQFSPRVGRAEHHVLLYGVTDRQSMRSCMASSLFRSG
jgi:hypothetical protein